MHHNGCVLGGKIDNCVTPRYALLHWNGFDQEAVREWMFNNTTLKTTEMEKQNEPNCDFLCHRREMHACTCTYACVQVLFIFPLQYLARRRKGRNETKQYVGYHATIDPSIHPSIQSHLFMLPSRPESDFFFLDSFQSFFSP